MIHDRPVLLVTSCRPPDRVVLVRTFDDGARAEVRWPSGGWMIVQTACLLDPPSNTLTDRATVLDMIVAQAAHAAARLSYLDAAVLEQFETSWTSGLTAEQLAARFADTGIDVAELPKIVDRHEHSGWLAPLPTRRRTSRGRNATVRRLTALGQLVVQQRHASQEVPTR